MAVTIGSFSRRHHVAILIVGARFFTAPYTAASGYGVSVMPRPGWDAYLSVNRSRDIVSGIFAAILIANRSACCTAGSCLLRRSSLLTDMAIVVRHRGARTLAVWVHGGTAAIMLVATLLLLLG